MKNQFYNKLSFRLIVSIILILLVNLAVFAFYTLTELEKDLIKSSSQNSYNISDVIKRSTRYSMLLNRRYDVHQIINTIGHEPGIEKVRIYNKQGMIIFSSDTTEILTQVNTTAEQCVVCHVENKPVADLPEKDRIRIYNNSRGDRVMGLINPIGNEEECSNAACHAHSSSQEILGVLDVVVSMNAVENVIQGNNKRIINNTLLISFVISLFVWMFIRFLVNKPLRKISSGMEEIGKGNLEYRIDVHSKDELGSMAFRFNDMSARLDQAYREIREWSETLNEKVNEKTEELKKIYQQIIQIEKLASLGKLSATVAHELNNPLEGILTYSKLISKKLSKFQPDEDNTKIIQYLNLISDESSRCGRIVKDLLLFSHRSDESFSSEDLIAIVDKSILLINHHLEMHRIKLVRNFPSERIILQCDSQKLQQALICLFINAIEAMPACGTITIDIITENRKAILRIKDEGTGITEKDLPHIFEPFFTTKKDSKGTGLGLAVVYGIIEQHKGTIQVESTSPDGTVFKIILPIQQNKE